MAEHPPSKRAKVDPAIARFQSAIFNLAGVTAAPVATSEPAEAAADAEAAAAADDGARRAKRGTEQQQRDEEASRAFEQRASETFKTCSAALRGAQDGERVVFNLASPGSALGDAALELLRDEFGEPVSVIFDDARAGRATATGVAWRIVVGKRVRDGALLGAALCVTGAQDNNGRWTSRAADARHAAAPGAGGVAAAGAGAPLFGGVAARASGADRKSEATLYCPFFSIARRARRARAGRALALALSSLACRESCKRMLVPAIAPDKEDAPDEDGDIVSEAEAFWAAQGFRRDRTDATGELARRLAESTNVNVSGTIIMVLSFDDDEAPE